MSIKINGDLNWKLRVQRRCLLNYNRYRMVSFAITTGILYQCHLRKCLGSTSFVQSSLMPERGCLYGLRFARRHNYYLRLYHFRRSYCQAIMHLMLRLGRVRRSKLALLPWAAVPALMTSRIFDMLFFIPCDFHMFRFNKLRDALSANHRIRRPVITTT